MMWPLVAGLFILIAFYTGYLVSLFVATAHNRADQGDNSENNLTERQRRRLNKLVEDPQMLNRIAMFYKYFMLVIVSFITAGLSLMAVYLEVGSWIYTSLPALLLVWSLYIVVVEYLPRRAVRRNIGEGRARSVWLVSLIYGVFFPAASLFRKALKYGEQEAPVSEEEKEEIVERAIESLADQAGIEEAIIEEDEKEMIGHIFQLDQTVVREIMVPRTKISAIDLNTKLPDIRAMVERDGYSRYPVFTDTIDSIVGILYVKDLFSRPSPDGEKIELASYLHQPFVVPESKIISELLREFKSQKVHIAVVVDEYGGVAGLVTLEDILEEIVGEIRDEHDVEEDPIKRLPDGSYLVDAGLLLEELQEFLQTDYGQGEYDTVSGLIYDLVGSVPSQGASVSWHDLEFEIDRVEGQRITRVRVLPSRPTDQP